MSVSHAELARLGWTRVDPRPWTKLRALWRSSSGWTLQHCGHPTANWPWALYDPSGAMVLSGVLSESRNPEFGVAWRRLDQAARWVAEHGRAFMLRRSRPKGHVPRAGKTTLSFRKAGPQAPRNLIP